MKAPVGIVLIFLSTFTLGKNATLEERIRDDSDLSQFYSLLERNQVAMASLKYRSLTLFAPTNEAFQRFTGNTTHVLYHISTVATTLEQLGTTISSDLEGNPPLYITRRGKASQEQIFINNALVLRSRSNVQLQNSDGRKQVLHVIDDVLQPLTVLPSSSIELFSPDAFQFLTYSESLDVNSHRMRSYREKVIMNKKENVFQAVGSHTFFIPVDEGFKPPPRADLFDKKVIDGHVIPNLVLFTAAAPYGDPLRTLAFEDNLKVQITFSQSDSKPPKIYVTSNTMIGDGKHTPGNVLAEVVKANIPVKNGVVHLISKPLMIVDNTVKEFLEDKDDGPLNKFYEVIMKVGSDFMQSINGMKNVTLFAPSNEAWATSNLDNLIKDKDRMRDILNLHIVKDRLTIDKIKKNNVNAISQVPTNADKKFLYFNVITDQDNNETITVEGGGVNATLIQADIAATNGYVHIIDRVLGIPYTTVYEKLKSDPMLNKTYHLGMLPRFNEQLDNVRRKYTFFVPRDKAWRNLERTWPSTYKKLFMPAFSYHASSILEHHLILADRSYTMADLKALANDSVVVLSAMRGILKLKIREEDRQEDNHMYNPHHQEQQVYNSGYAIQFNNRWINVFRPDVECTNGVIHVIDFPLMEESDMKINVASVSSTATLIKSSLIQIIVLLGIFKILCTKYN
ncbi:fasciclin-1 isoform X2 [Lutzomyia longipalpis]|uniref:fasciclin-1 isoform X2 n=1 Tax=Lutzomyia longipalpis TaxID=7200 RepID=UPI0024838999|nr:fasciclin-1 isoform X2 [Lutzomyia longipalpis]